MKSYPAEKRTGERTTLQLGVNKQQTKHKNKHFTTLTSGRQGKMAGWFPFAASTIYKKALTHVILSPPITISTGAECGPGLYMLRAARHESQNHAERKQEVVVASHLVSVVQHRKGPDDVPQLFPLELVGPESHLLSNRRQQVLVSLQGEGDDEGQRKREGHGQGLEITLLM